MKIYAPVKDANGVYASVRFVNGVGETDNPRLISWFKSHGYTVDDESQTTEVISVEEVKEDIQDDVEMMGYYEEQPNFEEMTPNELREWAKAHGLGMAIKNIRNKEKLLEVIRG